MMNWRTRLTGNQYWILKAFDPQDNKHSLEGIAEAASIFPRTCRRNLDRLEEKGFVVKTHPALGKNSPRMITEAGKAALAQREADIIHLT